MNHRDNNNENIPVPPTTDLEGLRRYIQILEAKNSQLENSNRSLSQQLSIVTKENT